MNNIERTIKVLESLGGRATTELCREKATELFPGNLARLIHISLHKLVERHKVKSSVVGRYKQKRKEIEWELLDYKPYAQIDYTKKSTEHHIKAKSRAMKEREFPGHDFNPSPVQQVQVDPTPVPVPELKIESRINPHEMSGLVEPGTKEEDDFSQAKEQLTAQAKLQQVETEKEPTVSEAINEAIKEPYLDSLKEMANSVDSSTRYRGRHDIVFDILKLLRNQIKGEANFTKIMYGCNLSFPQMRKYIAVAIKNGLVSLLENSNYTITTKGEQYSLVMDSIKIDFN